MENKLVWTDDVLTAYQAGFGKELSYYSLKVTLERVEEAFKIEDGRYVDGKGVSLVVEDGKIVGFYFPDGAKDFEHEAEAFERIAFELKKERDLLIELFKNSFDPCEVCAFNEDHEECDSCDCSCAVCGNSTCKCKNCLNENFCFDARRAERIFEK